MSAFVGLGIDRRIIGGVVRSKGFGRESQPQMNPIGDRIRMISIEDFELDESERSRMNAALREGSVPLTLLLSLPSGPSDWGHRTTRHTH